MNQYYQHTETKHQVDNWPLVADAMETLRVKLPYTRVNVWPDEKGMTYQIVNPRYADGMRKEAEDIIKNLNLPLVVNIENIGLNKVMIITPKII